MDDTFVIKESKHSQQLIWYINSQDLHIQFTTEDPNQEGSLPSLDTLVLPGPTNTLVTTVYRKSTHLNQFLHWDSNHFILAKNSVFNTLAFRAKLVCSNEHMLHQENDHIRKAVLACNFPLWASVVYSLDSTTGTISTIHRLSAATNKTAPTTVVSTTKTLPLLFLTQKALVKGLRRLAIVWVSRFILKATTLSQLYLSPPRTKTTNVEKVG